MNVSDAYLVAVNAAREQTTFQAEFGFVPPGAREGLSISQSGFGRWGDRLSQLNNRTYGMGGKWASLELNRPVLGDGWRYINPAIFQQTGDWSIAQSLEDGTFSTPPRIEMTLDKAYDVIGVQIIFDDLGEEWATEIKVSYYNNAHALVEAKTFQNDRVNMPIDWQYNGVRYIGIDINRWNLPRRFAKVCQVIPGQIRYFRDENTYSFTLKEKISPFDALTIPEYTIVFPNENQEYNIINPTGLISKLREFMEMPSQIGLVTMVGIEYVSTGNFPLFSWPDSANDETAAFVCQPDLAFANKNYVFTGSLTQTTQTVAQVADTISSQAALKTPIYVDETLRGRNINAKVDLYDQMPLQNALGQLAIAAGGYIKFERDGTYKLKPISYVDPVRTIDFNGMWDKPAIVQSQMIAGVTVKYVKYRAAQPIFDHPEAIDSYEVFVSSGNSIGRNIVISSNFILNDDEARRVGGLALSFFQNRLSYSIEYRGDMSIEAGDVVSVETDYGFRNVLVLEHEITYDTDNFLQGKIAGIEI